MVQARGRVNYQELTIPGNGAVLGSSFAGAAKAKCILIVLPASPSLRGFQYISCEYRKLPLLSDNRIVRVTIAHKKGTLFWLTLNGVM